MKLNLFRKPKIITQEIKLSKGQQKLMDLYIDAYGKAYIWTKKKTTKVLDPNEIISVEGKIS